MKNKREHENGVIVQPIGFCWGGGGLLLRHDDGRIQMGGLMVSWMLKVRLHLRNLGIPTAEKV